MNEENRPTKYSVVIPVFNSAALVGETIDRVVAFFEGKAWDYELILVNDGSRDGSWDILREKALANPHIIAISLLRNYGQHSALLCGFHKSRGDYVITMDDDMQNPPEEITHLVQKASEGHDVVFARFRKKKHAWYRRWGSFWIRLVNRRIFHQPKGLVLSNFRIIERKVVDRICSYKTRCPYITGLAIMFSANPANVVTEHKDRPVGESNYSFFKIAKLVMRILFNYSSFPLRLVSVTGLVIAALSFALGLFYVARAVFVGSRVPGWTTVVVLLSFFSGMIFLMLGILGEYVIRVLAQTSSPQSYHVKETIGPHD